ncbi:hypothetical protein FGO68_gene12557 [Halteria grandinella]|uniref:Uncharacterized protein n=1 Tax=Halteria grandinella TaxID=5974 RepID=A0A8J8NHZ9_HALGN|nr:hypothetical protein FGO68_gene12557 [Halteria grandinella]
MHTGNAECGDFPQGWQMALRGAPWASQALIELEAVAYGKQCSVKYHVDSFSQQAWVPTECAWPDSGVEIPIINLSLSYYGVMLPDRT